MGTRPAGVREIAGSRSSLAVKLALVTRPERLSTAGALETSSTNL
jgi:hypothetical protein